MGWQAAALGPNEVIYIYFGGPPVRAARHCLFIYVRWLELVRENRTSSPSAQAEASAALPRTCTRQRGVADLWLSKEVQGHLTVVGITHCTSCLVVE